MRVLVTGATGFVGANLVRRLHADGHVVHALVQRASSRWRLQGLRTRLRLHEAGLESRSAVEAVVRRVRPEWVFHLAAYGAYSWQTDLDRMVRTNVVGTMNLVRACLRTGVAALVNTGSSSEYGFKDHPPGEREWLDPNSHYAVTKAAQTLFCRHTAIREGVHLPTLRLYSVYGPWEEPGRLVPTLVLHGMERRLPPLVAPDVARDYVYTDDVSDAFVRAAAVAGQERGAVYNVGSGRQTTLAEVVDVVRRLMRVDAEPVWGSMPGRAWDTTVWVADNARIRAALGWEPRHDLEDGLGRMVAWLAHVPGIVRRYRHTPAPGAAARAARRAAR
jgi:nucleoside-diphosphate-sugar epimerase